MDRGTLSSFGLIVLTLILVVSLVFTIEYVADISTDSIDNKTESILSDANSFDDVTDISPEKICKFTIIFTFEDGLKTMKPYVTYYKVGDIYQFEVPDIEGYNHADNILIGTIDGDYTREIVYTPIE